MKKSLIALAVFGAFTGAAMAQGSNVQLYGLIDAGVTHFTGISNGAGGTTSSTGLSSGVQSGDRIGLKGTEDLGGGLSAIFDVETGFCGTGLSQGEKAGVGGTPAGGFCTGGGFMQRQSWVGLAGNFGKVLGGRMYTNGFNNETAMDPFGYGLTGNIGTLSLAPARTDQTLVYITPNLSGFTGDIAYVFSPAGGTVPGATVPANPIAGTPATSYPSVPRAVSVDGQYANGPVVVGASYTEASNVGLDPTPNSAGTYIANGKNKMWQVFGSYDFGVAKVSALYEALNWDNSGVIGGVNQNDQKHYMLGLTVPVGPGAILASYNHLDNGMPDGAAKQYAIGYTYSLSKQTDLYASYAHLTNGANIDKAVGSSTDGFTGVDGQNSSGMAIGIRHMF